jgi:hypothetical protein
VDPSRARLLAATSADCLRSWSLSADVDLEGGESGVIATQGLFGGWALYIHKTVPFRFSTEETLDFGEDTGTPVDMSYDLPFKFTGELGKIVIDLK